MSMGTSFPRKREFDGVDGMTTEQVLQGVNSGGRFVVFEYCVSVILMTSKAPTNKVYYIPPGTKTYSKSLPFTLCTLLFGWWGIPWGPIYTISALATNLRGGKDVTPEAMASLGFSRGNGVDPRRN
jgi:hypothetical protein